MIKISEPRELQCETCGNSFQAKSDHGKWPRFCGRACFRNQPKRHWPITCAGCGNTFYVHKHRTRAKYCGQSCAAASAWKNSDTRRIITDAARRNYNIHAISGVGIRSHEAINKSKVAAKWIFTEARLELSRDTEFNLLRKEVYRAFCVEFPYEGSTDAEYIEYLARIARLTAADSRVRELFDGFMSEAIPRWGAEWQRRKNECQAA